MGVLFPPESIPQSSLFTVSQVLEKMHQAWNADWRGASVQRPGSPGNVRSLPTIYER